MIKSKANKLDRNLLFAVLGLITFGLIMVYNASSSEALRDFNDKYFYLKYQIIWAFLGTILMFIFSFINYKIYHKLMPPFFLINIILLILVIIPGISTPIKGARRWINLGLFSIQPSELLKLTFVGYLSIWLTKNRSLWQFLFLTLFLLFLIMIEPDMGTAVVVVVTALLLYFSSGGSIINILAINTLGLISGLVIIMASTYRKQRFLTFLNPSLDPLGASYHVRQILIALGSGGLFGLGLGQSRQKYQYLPEASTDSIFGIIGEELGFVGAIFVIGVLFYIIYRGFKIAKKAPDTFSKILAAGISICLGIQAIINLSAMVALIPLTGLPLPFISYGGSSLTVSLISIGILLNISKYRISAKK